MKLYNANLSPNALRVRAVVNELGIALEVIDVDLRSGGNRTPEFLALNPNGKVPVLVDGDFVLWESRAINAYLAKMKPEAGLYPADARKQGVIDQWSSGMPCISDRQSSVSYSSGCSRRASAEESQTRR